ncbi:MAG: chemotaxis protein CheX [Archangium sp.]|nr:chemotaxis protein CheX [Archangium sp.]
MSKFPTPDSLTSMVNSVTTTMMNVKFVLAPAAQHIAPFRRAVLPIPGVMPVAVVVTGDEASCQKLGARLFSVTLAAVDVSMMEDTLRELANITAGQVKRAMSMDAALGLPRIVVGAEPWGERGPAKQLIVLRADCDDIHLEVQVASDAS